MVLQHKIVKAEDLLTLSQTDCLFIYLENEKRHFCVDEVELTADDNIVCIFEEDTTEDGLPCQYLYFGKGDEIQVLAQYEIDL